MRALFALLPLLAACSGGSNGPTPGPSPVPSPLTITGSIADTVSGAVIGQFTQTVNSLPARVTVSQGGYVTRDTWVHGDGGRVDLFPEAGFDLAFYRQFARDALDSGTVQPLRLLTQAPAIYLQTAALTDADVAALHATAQAVIPALTGGRMALSAWETGGGAGTPRRGWITVDVTTDSSRPCGETSVGASIGRMTLNAAPRCGFAGRTIDLPLFAHELGHALGFWHVAAPGHLMKPRATFAERTSIEPSVLERHHAALAYSRQAGNTDVDSDPLVPSTFQTRVIID